MAPSCDQNQGTLPLVLTWVLLSIALVVTSARFYVRILYRNPWWDDYVALMSLVVGIIAGSFFTVMITSGMGRHVNCLAPESVVSMLEFSAISEAINVIGIGLVKISVCLCLIRIVDRARQKITRFLWVLLVFVAFTHLALALVFFLHCRPLAALWNNQVRGSCYSTRTTVLTGYIGFAIDIITDIVCAIVPVLVIRQLQMGLRTKIALCIVMALGVSTAIFAVIKALTLRNVFADDYTYSFTQPAQWAAIEQFTGLIIISLPSLKLFFGSVLDGSFTKSRSGSISRQDSGSNALQKLRKWRVGSVFSSKRRPSASQSNPSSQVVESPPTETTFSYGKTEKSVGVAANRERDLEASLPPPNHLSQWHVPRLADRWSTVFSIGQASRPTSQVRNENYT